MILLNRATCLAQFLEPDRKTYRLHVRLGRSTTTDDEAGETVLDNQPIPSEADLRAALETFQGTLDQTPPAYSAVHVAGQRAYALARRGETVDLPSRKVTIYSIAWERWSPPDLTLQITSSPGTYMRSLARDLGLAVGSAAYAASIRRLAIGTWHVDDLPLNEPLPVSEVWQPKRTLPLGSEAARKLIETGDIRRSLESGPPPQAGTALTQEHVDPFRRMLGVAGENGRFGCRLLLPDDENP